jgi:hypothetical protein
MLSHCFTHKRRIPVFRSLLLLIVLMASSVLSTRGQSVEKIRFDASDSTNGYYLATPPLSNTIKGVVVLICNFRPPESLLPETRLHSVGAVSNILTIYASMGRKLFADGAATDRINMILQHIMTRYKVDSSLFVLGGYDLAGAIALRYTELAYEHPAQFALRPKAAFAISPFVDLAGLYHWSERQIKKNTFPPAVNDARTIQDLLTKELGTPTDHPEQYKKLSPFYKDEETAGNEQFLQHLPIRLYYDTDISWQLNARRNSLYDTNIPDGTELINRLLLAGNTRAEFIASKVPGVKSNGIRTPSALSILDEADCMQWVKDLLHILDPSNPLAWSAPYRFVAPEGWTMEHTYLPAPFAPHVQLKGIEDIRFPPGWANASSDEYWTVAYLFWLDAGQPIDGEMLQKTLKIYYDDLVPGGLMRRDVNLPADQIPPAEVSLKKIKIEPDDLQTYTGTIKMLDYMAQKPILLYYMAHVKSCNAQNKTPLFLEISPKPFEHPIWKTLEGIKGKFDCQQ